MPKRSNQFQRVVTYIAEKLAPLGATVRESVELPEIGLDGVVREMDTLIELTAGITVLRVAIESRDRARTDVVPWIDELIGKYKNLAVDRIVAVSNSGFSSAAKAKAALNRIELLTPEEVESVDWPARFQKLGVATVVGQLKIEHFQFSTTPPFPGEIELERDRIRREADGQSADVTVREFVEELGPHIVSRAQRHQKEKFLSIYETRADLEKTAIIDMPVPAPNLWLLSQGSRYRIEAISARVSIVQQVTNILAKHSLLGEDAMVTSANFDGVAMTVAQAANADGGKVFLDRLENKTTTQPKEARTTGKRVSRSRKRTQRP